ncbi:hypothetical protein Tco_1474178 [Tanacetum coccineum]
MISDGLIYCRSSWTIGLIHPFDLGILSAVTDEVGGIEFRDSNTGSEVDTENTGSDVDGKENVYDGDGIENVDVGIGKVIVKFYE